MCVLQFCQRPFILENAQVLKCCSNLPFKSLALLFLPARVSGAWRVGECVRLADYEAITARM